MDHPERSTSPPSSSGPSRLFLGLGAILLLTAGFVAGIVRFEKLRPDRLTFDLYWVDFPGAEPRFVETRSLDLAASEEIRVTGDLGEQAVLVLCTSSSPENPCGEEGVTPRSSATVPRAEGVR